MLEREYGRNFCAKVVVEFVGFVRMHLWQSGDIVKYAKKAIINATRFLLVSTLKDV